MFVIVIKVADLQCRIILVDPIVEFFVMFHLLWGFLFVGNFWRSGIFVWIFFVARKFLAVGNFWGFLGFLAVGGFWGFCWFGGFEGVLVVLFGYWV